MPPGVVTLKNQSVAFCPQGRGGTTAVTDVVPEIVYELTFVMFSVATDALLPNVTADAPFKLVPVRVTEVPPDAEPVPERVPERVGATQL